MKKITLSLSALALLTSSIFADDIMFSKYAVGIKGGTTGIGIELTTPLLANLNLRAGISGYNYSTSTSKSDIDYDFDLKLMTINLLADYYPFKSSQFRITGGVTYNGNKLDMTGKPTSSGTYTFNNVSYTTSQVSSVDATVDFNKVAPYIGIGWGDAVQKAGWNFTADAGVMFQGTPNSDITVNTTLTGAAKDTLLANVNAEQSQLDDDLSAFKYYPVLTVGVSYRF